MLKDIVFALRTLARHPGFTCVAAATLALGIGVNTAIFSVVEGVLLKPLPFKDPDRLSIVWQRSTSGAQLAISELDLNDYRSRTRVFEGLAGFTRPGTKSAILTGAGNPVEIAPSYITGNYFSVLGLAPVIGRDFLPEERRRGQDPVAILGYTLWQTRFGGSRDVLHQQIMLNKQRLQVVGVMGPDVYPIEVDVFVPFTSLHPEKPLARNYHELDVVGRLRPGSTVADGQREMAALTADLERAYPSTNAGLVAHVVPLREEITGNIRQPILILLSAVGLIMLIACANVANLMLVRAASRQKEIAIRVALGAGRDRIVRQFMIECLMLAAAGALFGLLLAFFCMPLIHRLGAERIPRLQHVRIDSTVLLFTAAITVFTGLLFGLIPALRYSTANLSQILRAGGRTSRSDSGRLRHVLVAGEVALAMVVIVGASLLLRSLTHLHDVPPGFRADHLLVARLALPLNLYKQPEVHNFFVRLLPKIAAIPGVTSVATTTALPLASAITQTRFAVQGVPVPEPGKYPVTAFASVDGEFFKTMGIPILRGRTFSPEEVGNFEPTHCIINATLARNFFAGQDPIGRTVITGVAAIPPDTCQIVGVAGDTRVSGLDAPPLPFLYFTAYVARENVVVRTATDPMSVAAAVRQAVNAADREQPLSDIRSMDQVLSQSLSRRSFAAVLLALFASLGLILAALGLYGILSYSVAQRTQEIGVRMALGAEPGSVFRMILLQGLWVTGIGLVIGIIAAAATSRMMSGLLYGIQTVDPLSFVAGCVLLTAVSAVACFVPAYRATRVDPLTALRHE